MAKRLGTSVQIACMLLFVSLAHSQAPSTPPPTAASPIGLTLEEKHVIKEWVKDVPVEPGQLSGSISIGSVVPSSVRLQPFPAQVAEKVSHVRSHVFFVHGEEVIIVDPKDKKVVDTIK